MMSILIDILKECYRVLKKDRVLAILDLDKNELSKVIGVCRKWAFKITEPHIYDYYKNDIPKELIATGFSNMHEQKNDPKNTVLLCI